MTAPTTPRVTAIVVVYGAPPARISACLDSLHDSRGIDVRTIVVDNGSPDGGAAATAVCNDRPGVQLVRSASNLGFAGGVNLGLRHRGADDAVWLLNDDATVLPDTVSRCVQLLQAGGDRCIAVAPKMLLASEPGRIDAVGTVLRPNGEAFNAGIGQPDVGQFAHGTQVFGPCFGAALFRADAFRDDIVGALDERYFLYYEDIDWDIRAAHRGFLTLAATDAVVHHEHATSTRLMGEPRRFAMVQRNLLLCVSKNFHRRAVLRIWAQRTVVHAKGCITGPYRWARVTAMAGALVRLPAALLARREARRGHLLDNPAMFRFAQGQEPFFDATTYRASRPTDAAAAAARKRPA